MAIWDLIAEVSAAVGIAADEDRKERIARRILSHFAWAPFSAILVDGGGYLAAITLFPALPQLGHDACLSVAGFHRSSLQFP